MQLERGSFVLTMLDQNSYSVLLDGGNDNDLSSLQRTSKEIREGPERLTAVSMPDL